ncbi:Ups1 protein [Saccharomycopsis crataegensis]|uniref:Ups1 protein n=1 Tax=Saccharomycopsis crataegensis TaxID=43959 RepID=A0AAV5QN85_9ASCO|nr:Ups1 protein [Saccharomycopsis crataegensis]
MVLCHKSTNQYDYSFPIVSYSWLNRYPNPYAKHVISVDTLDSSVDEHGKLHITKLIRKSGSIPSWAKPFLSITDSWIVEKAVIDPATQTMETYTRNLDHTGVIRIEEFNNYFFDDKDEKTYVKSSVKFTSAFRQYYGFSIKDKIENWSHSKFTENIKKSRQGLLLVMQNFQTRRLKNNV